MDALDKHFHAVAKALGRGKDARLGMTPTWGFLEGETFDLGHSRDCEDFGVEEGCRICDPENTTDHPTDTHPRKNA